MLCAGQQLIIMAELAKNSMHEQPLHSLCNQFAIRADPLPSVQFRAENTDFLLGMSSLVGKDTGLDQLPVQTLPYHRMHLHAGAAQLQCVKILFSALQISDQVSKQETLSTMILEAFVLRGEMST